jgi:hypothetical protein
MTPDVRLAYVAPTIIVSLYRGWRSGYDCRHVNAIARALAAHMTIPYRLVCVTDIPAGITECETYPLWEVGVDKVGYGKPNCFWRLRLHDKEFACQFGELVVSMDIDCAIFKDPSPLFRGGEPFKIIRGTERENALNGSMWMVRPGAHQEIWDTFDARTVVAEIKVARLTAGRHVAGSDQALMALRILDPATWGPEDGVYSWRFHVEPAGEVPANARMVFFAGRRKPWDRSVGVAVPAVAEQYLRFF